MWRETSKLREEEEGQQHDYQQQYRQNCHYQEHLEASRGREGEENIETEERIISEDKLCDFGEIFQPPPKRIRIESGNPLDIIESHRQKTSLPPSSSRTRDNIYCLKRKRIKDEDDANGNESDSSFPNAKRNSFFFSSHLAPHLADIEFH